MKTLLQFIRMPAGLSVVSNIVAAHVIATHGTIQWLNLFLTVSAGLCLYYAGMGLNDCFDFFEDRANRRQRPLPSGQLSLSTGWTVSLMLMVLGLVLAFAVGTKTLLIAVLLSVFIVLYDSKVLSDFPSAWVMAGCRYLVWLMAMSVVNLTSISYLLPLPLFFYISGLTLLATAETGKPSKSVLYMSLPFFTAAAAVAAALTLLLSHQIWVFLILLASLAVYVSRILHPLWTEFRSDRVQQAITRLLMGIIAIDAFMLAMNGYLLWSVCILLLLLPGKVLVRWLYVS